MKKILIFIITALLAAPVCRADEGMWLPNLIGSRVKDMKSKGFRLSASDIYDVNRACMKDAVVKFGNGCTGELISSEGLLLTNHHCGYGEIQSHSSLENDYLTDGFWAMSRAEELPNPGLTVTFLVSMTDVTPRIPADTAARRRVIGEIVKEAVDGTRYQASVESFYYGNQYFLFVYDVFSDVRLVGAPPSSIGKFGGDTDNWMWPRHTGDFSLFRIYAAPDNSPAAYSKDNVPYRPKSHFKISTRGVGEGDFTFIYGLPARTSEYLVSDAVEYTVEKSNPAKIALREARLDEINRASAADAATRIKYAAKAASIANAWKKWQGESLGLKRLGTVARKRAEEAAFERWAASLPASDPRREAYMQVLTALHGLYAELEPYALARDYFNEAFGALELTGVASWAGSKPAGIDEFYKDYDEGIDRRIAVKMLTKYISDMPARFVPRTLEEGVAQAGSVAAFVDRLYLSSAFASKSRLNPSDTVRLRLLSDPGSDGADPAVKLAYEFRKLYDSVVRPRYTILTDSIYGLYSVYMRGLMERQPERDFYPDANFTLRVAYGKVASYRPEDGVIHDYRTTVEGIMEKEDPAVYDYAVPARLKELYALRDYGRWADGGALPVAFIATNHTSGGNSGSPVLNGRGELVGLNFDRTWLSTMSDVEFDPSMCRNISADIRYVCFVIEKVGGAGYLLDEMTFAK